MCDRVALFRAARERFGDARLTSCGLTVEGRYGPRFVFPTNYLLFPFLDQGEVLYLQARRGDDGKQQRWLCPTGLVPPVYNIDALKSSNPTVFICEGVTDVLSAAELGKSALGLLGANSHFDISLIAKLKQRNVIVVGDGDGPGLKFARSLVNLLGTRGITAISRPPPVGCNDLNDYLRLRKSKAA
jgi:DNA primase